MSCTVGLNKVAQQVMIMVNGNQTPAVLPGACRSYFYPD